MLGLGRGVTLALVGWLWADLLLGMFAIFLAANSAGVAIPQRAPSPVTRESSAAFFGIDPKAVLMTVTVDGKALLSDDRAAVAREQIRIANEVQKNLVALAGARRAALVLAFGSHESPTEGDRLARLATELLRTGSFDGAVLKPYHELVPGDAGSVVNLEVYLYY